MYEELFQYLVKQYFRLKNDRILISVLRCLLKRKVLNLTKILFVSFLSRLGFTEEGSSLHCYIITFNNINDHIIKKPRK